MMHGSDISKPRRSRSLQKPSRFSLLMVQIEDVFMTTSCVLQQLQNNCSHPNERATPIINSRPLLRNILGHLVVLLYRPPKPEISWSAKSWELCKELILTVGVQHDQGLSVLSHVFRRLSYPLCSISGLCVLQISYWRQFEQGLLGGLAVRKLIEAAETAADKPDQFITADIIKATWQLSGYQKLLPRLVS